MKIYADTGFLVSLHAADANSTKAAKLMAKMALPLPWTWLHELEFRNAMRLKVFRGEIDSKKAGLVFLDVSEDLENGVYRRVQLPGTVSIEAERLSARHTESLGVRSLDILHVAQAVSLGAKTFVTFDKRQAALAQAAGLAVVSL